MKHTVGILGVGGVGQTLGLKLHQSGHVVYFGSRHPGKKVDDFPGTPVALSWEECCAKSDVIILAIPGVHTDAAIEEMAKFLPSTLKGKVLIDATNPLSPYPGLAVRWSAGRSAAEVLQEHLPEVFVFKAFNTIGREFMENCFINDTQLTMLFCGGPKEKVKLVFDTVAGVGFIPRYVGPITYARNLEAIAELWIHLGVPGVGTSEKVGRNFHFQFLQGSE